MVDLTIEEVELLIAILEEYHPHGMEIELEEKDKDEILEKLYAAMEELDYE